jgi:hypothetical protein
MKDFLQFKNSFKIMGILEKYSNNPITSSSSGSSSRLKYFKYLSFGLLVYSTYRFFKSSAFFNKNKKKELLQVKKLPEHVKYDNGWYAEFDNLNSGGIGENVMPTPPPTIQEATPRGEILMYYDVKNKEFVYYSNNKNLPYRTLDAVARKYVCLNNIPSIYVDIREEVKKGFEKCKNKAKYIDSATATSSLSSSSSLYAVYKNYKSGATATTSAADINSVGKNLKKVILKDNVNKFIFKGRIDDFALDVKAREKKEKSFEKTRNRNDGNEQKGGGNDDKMHEDDLDNDNEEKEKKNISYSEFKKKNARNS